MAPAPGRPVRPATAAGGTGSGLRVRDLVVRYDDGGAGVTTAVAGVSLDVAPGEVVALLGPSGCGKSSLLRAVAGLEPPAAGTVSWDGADLADVPVHRRGFGLMFQEGQLFAHRDVAHNVAYGLQMAGVPRGERTRRVADGLRAVGLDGYGRRAVSTLSGGEQQRVALARALAPAPQLLLLDEPLSALDRALRERLAADVRSTLVATGTTALFVTHDHDEAFTVADRVAVMSAGRILRIDTPARLWRRPGSRAVAEFLGYRAFVPLDETTPVASAVRRALAAEAGSARADRGGAARAGAVAALAEGALVVLPSGEATVSGVVEQGVVVHGVVVRAAFRRGRSEVLVEVEGAGRVTAVAPGVSTVHPGDRVGLAVDTELVAVLTG
ncbi:ABC transporter ATP-binding protein [Cellulomonas aerilata]|uniref:ABC transporter ATP-binding protein n=1 Tax=Cellulomonas aerilata TaxID=515326 RepID=UPI0011BF0DF3|nr:ABC transporter ATP-binding protein [Cellulomonas aerilata]